MAKSATYQAIIALGAKLDKTFGPTLKTAQKGFQSVGKGFQAVGGAMVTGGKIIGAGLLAAGTASAAFSAQVIKQFGELEQNLGGSEAVFGQWAKTIQAYGEDAYKTLGVSQSEYLATANKMGALFQGSGIEQQRSLDLTAKAMQRAADMASVMGIDMQVAMESVAGAAKGNFTMMDNLGVAMNATNIQAYALSKGMNFKWNTATQAQKAEVAMQMFFESTSDHDGNFAREATESVTGSFGLMKAAYGSFLAGFGNKNANMSNLTKNLIDAFKTVVKNIKPILKNIALALPDTLATMFPKATPYINKLWKFGAKAFDAIRDKGSAAIDDIQSKWQQYGPKIIGMANTARDKIVSAFNWIRDTGGESIANIRAKFSETQPKVSEFISLIRDKLQAAFDISRPAIEWIFTEGFPAVIGIGGDLLGKISAIYNFFNGNWNLISPIVYGIVGAFVAYKAITLATKGATLIMNAAQQAQNVLMVLSVARTGGLAAAQTALAAVQGKTTVAQWALNAAMNANPMMIVVAAVGALIAVGVLLYKNWDTIKEKAGDLCGHIQEVFGGVAGWFGGIWETAKAGFKAFINFIIGGLNKIPQGLNSLKVTMPDWVPGMGGKTLGFNIPSIPMLYTGVRNWSGGPAIVGDRGPELLNLPRGTDVFSNPETRSMLTTPQDFGSAFGDIVLKVTNIIKGPITKQQAEEAAQMTEQEFEKLLDRLLAKRRRASFTG